MDHDCVLGAYDLTHLVELEHRNRVFGRISLMTHLFGEDSSEASI